MAERKDAEPGCGDLVDRVARVMLRAYSGILEDAETGRQSDFWDIIAPDVKDRWRRAARAALSETAAALGPQPKRVSSGTAPNTDRIK